MIIYRIGMAFVIINRSALSFTKNYLAITPCHIFVMRVKLLVNLNKSHTQGNSKAIRNIYWSHQMTEPFRRARTTDPVTFFLIFFLTSHGIITVRKNLFPVSPVPYLTYFFLRWGRERMDDHRPAYTNVNS